MAWAEVRDGTPGAGGHLTGGGGIVLVRGQAGGCLDQTHDFHLRRAEQPGLVRNIVRPAGREGRVVTLAEPPNMHLERGWEQAIVFDLNGGVSRGNQDPKMANHRKTSRQQRGQTPDVWLAIMAEIRQVDDRKAGYRAQSCRAMYQTLSVGL
jgi:hypothetical protein